MLPKRSQVNTLMRQSAGRGDQMKRLPNSNNFSPQPSGDNMRLIPVAIQRDHRSDSGRYETFSVVENTGFNNMFKVLDPRYTITFRTHFAQTVIPALYNKAKEQIDMELSEKPSLGLTTDRWTSRATELP